MITKIEHVNITVPDIDAAVSFLQIIAPDFKIKKDEKPINDKRWMHIGNDEFYFALQEAPIATHPIKPNQTYINYGFNHIGLVVNNIDKIEKKLIKSGYQKGIDTPKETFRKRIYYFDNAGFEWELVEYLSEKNEDKYLYE
ncbi:Glyoxalase/Bleomycin resistance protein/Dioxygenase superfamily protein [Polaribacter sp. KT25b]|uniref:VOC family protein n=1 Tax=Polaribacter sp. KT25b TaxID=1855336 RepID=UPI00087CFB52|nr:VOC family protein [Polaribacter sp. KT25b]SDR86278.1 Glyoxalase/Bleomycin resistance protein/Dioxygenase superfamily protein [Polaribacter sp. KT25b]